MEQSEVRWAKPFEPNTRSYKPRIRNEQWEDYRDQLTEYHDRGMPRKEMLTRLRVDGFEPSKQQLDKRMLSWGLTVYPSRAAGYDNHLDTHSSNTNTPNSSQSTSDRAYRRYAGSETASRRSASPARSSYNSPYNEPSNRSIDMLDRDDVQSAYSAHSSRVTTPPDQSRYKKEFAALTSQRAASLAPSFVQKLCDEADAQSSVARDRSRAPSPPSSYGGDRGAPYTDRLRPSSNDSQSVYAQRTSYGDDRQASHFDHKSTWTDMDSTRASVLDDKSVHHDVVVRDHSPPPSTSRASSTRPAVQRLEIYTRTSSKPPSVSSRVPPPSCTGSLRSHGSMSSDTSSFIRLAMRLKGSPPGRHPTRTWSTTMSICSDDSWRLETVAGYPVGALRAGKATSHTSDERGIEFKVPGYHVTVSRGAKAS